MVTAAVALRATACRACACVAPCGGARVRAAAAPARTVGTERRRGGGVWVRCFVFRVVARPGRDTGPPPPPRAAVPAPVRARSGSGQWAIRGWVQSMPVRGRDSTRSRAGRPPAHRAATRVRGPGDASARDAHDRNMNDEAAEPASSGTGGTRIEIISNSIRRVCDTRAPHERGNAPRTTRARRRRVFFRAVTGRRARIESSVINRRDVTRISILSDGTVIKFPRCRTV